METSKYICMYISIFEILPVGKIKGGFAAIGISWWKGINPKSQMLS